MSGNASLIELTLHNFRSMGDSVVPFASGVTVLAGQNGAGKTSTIDALETLLGNLSLTSNDRSRFVGPIDPVIVDGAFRMSGVESDMHFRAILDGEEFRREVRVLRHRAFSVEPADMPLPALRQAMNDVGIASPGGTAKEPYVTVANAWIDSRPGDELVEEWRVAQRADLALLPALTRFDENHAEDPATYAQSLFTRSARQALVQPKYKARLAELAADVQADIAATLDELKSKVRKHCPAIDDLNIVAEFDFQRPAVSVSLELVRNGAPVPLATIGEGQKRRIAIAIHEASIPSLRTRAGTEILAYDEPDTHLDYSSQRELFDILQAQADIGSVQVLVATHSVNFIDRVSLDSLVHCRLEGNFQTVVETLRSPEGASELNFLQSICRGLGLRNSSLLSERAFLIVEGDTEEAALPGLYRVTTRSGLVADGVTVLNTKGSGAIKLLVEVMRNQWSRDVVVLTDSDAREKIGPWVSQIGLVEGRDLFFVGSKEFEDAFSDELWAKTLQHSFPPAQGTWASADVTAIRTSSSFGDDLCSLVRARCPTRLATKPDLGYALVQHIGSLDEIPAPIRRACEAVRAVARP